MLKSTVDHLIANVMPAARDYTNAEAALSAAFAAGNNDQTPCHAERNTAKRRAAEVAIAIDGLADRAALALGTSPNLVRSQVAPLCAINGIVRQGCLDRVCAVANAYKHATLSDPKHPIRSDADVLVVGAGYGIDGYGLGKFGGIEVMVRQWPTASYVTDPTGVVQRLTRNLRSACDLLPDPSSASESGRLTSH